ncbi:PREDICTED: uncharacterized protein LOC108362632 [Rhagoletis zephyria]|uniref:uncharacterized protein LOC108362632 n=1 Tax=Rhagoletis zephyria TaxID=28612 RepID=UPI0008117B98|nr:PREDICTED: uncharacterized protein LOC108362632 [Rhagoletis zephyria]
MKNIFVVFLLIATILAHANASQQQLGQILTTDATLGLTTLSQRFRLGQVVTVDYTFTGPSTTSVVRGITINDNRPPRKSPAVTITAGALGTNTVSIRLTSPRGLGINSQVTFYGTT